MLKQANDYGYSTAILIIRYRELIKIANRRKRFPLCPKGQSIQRGGCDESLLQLTIEAQSLKNHVNQALQKREPVAYNHNFLYDYKPNITYYLTHKEREHLNKTRAQSRFF